jgi:hypothetical protein
MTAFEILKNLEERGIEVWCVAGDIKMQPAMLLTETDLAEVRANKDEIVRRLCMPPHGSINFPMGVEGRRLAKCPWDGCAGEVEGHEKNNLYLCMKCGFFFELHPPMEGYVRNFSDFTCGRHTDSRGQGDQ